MIPLRWGFKPNQACFASLTGFVIFVTTAQATLGLVPKITKPRLSAGLDWGLAEREGFEPSMQLPTYYLSRVAPSTTRTPLLRAAKVNKNV